MSLGLFTHSKFRHQSGLSLVELMVAMVIGLIVSLAVFSVLQTFEGRKRSTTSVNDIDQAGNYALYTLDKLLRSAGSGLSQSDGAMFGCTLSASKGEHKYFHARQHCQRHLPRSTPA